MESFSLVKKYYKLALPLSLAIVLYEEISLSSSNLNKAARKFFLGVGENAEIFLSVAGGASVGGNSDLRGKEYHDSLTLKVYTPDESKTMPLKSFMVSHVTEYQAALFEGLAEDWPAISKWNINTEEGITYLEQAFGEDFLLEAFECSAALYAPHRT